MHDDEIRECQVSHSHEQGEPAIDAEMSIQTDVVLRVGTEILASHQVEQVSSQPEQRC